MEALPEEVLELVLSHAVHAAAAPALSACALRGVCASWEGVLVRVHVAPALEETRRYLDAMLVAHASRRALFRTFGARARAGTWTGLEIGHWWICLAPDPGRCTARTQGNAQCARRAVARCPLKMCPQHGAAVPFCLGRAGTR